MIPRVRASGNAAIVQKAIELNPVFWLDLVFRGGEDSDEASFPGRKLFYLPFPTFWYNVSPEIVASKKLIVLLGFRRALAKTTVLTVGHNLWWGFVDRWDYNVIVTADKDKASQIFRSFEMLVDSERFCKEYSPTGTFRGIKGTPWSATKGHMALNRKDGSSVFYEIVGWNESLYGHNNMGSRIGRLTLDDTTTQREADSVNCLAMTRSRIDRFDKEHLEALVKRDRFGRSGQAIIIDTPKTDNCFFSQMMTSKFHAPKMAKFIFPSIVTEETSQICGVPAGESMWEEMVPIEKERKDRDAFLNTPGKRHVWYTQREIRPYRADDDRKFDKDRDAIIVSKEHAAKIVERCTNLVCTVDMSYTKESWSDHRGINVSAHTPPNRILSLESMRGMWSEEELYDILVQINEKYTALVGERFGGIWIESLVFSMLHKLLDELGRRRGTILPLYNVAARGALYQESNRINRIVGYAQVGLMSFVEGANECLLDEMDAWTGRKLPGANDSVADATAYQTVFCEDTGDIAPPPDEELGEVGVRVAEWRRRLQSTTGADEGGWLTMEEFCEEMFPGDDGFWGYDPQEAACTI
jgi:hypothetical protein